MSTSALRAAGGSSGWIFPVGDPLEFGATGGGSAPYHVLRGIHRSRQRGEFHQGVDLSNGTAGDSVRAAAGGIVIVATPDRGNGYGGHVVLAHQSPGGALYYSVYAHLARGSIEVAPGDPVARGMLLGRVGRTGNASADHLHFEVREARSPEAAWEKAVILDPLAFVGAHRPGRETDGSQDGDGPVAWARRHDLIPDGLSPGATLSRSIGWRMLAVAVSLPSWRTLVDARDPRDLRAALARRGVLAPTAPRNAHGRIGRVEWQHALSALRGSLTPERRAELTPPAGLPEGPEAKPAKHPNVAEACRELARAVREPQPEAVNQQ